MELFKQYSKSKSALTSRSARSSRKYRPAQNKLKISEDKLQDSICGWSIENEETFNYLLKTKLKNKAVKAVVKHSSAMDISEAAEPMLKINNSSLIRHQVGSKFKPLSISPFQTEAIPIVSF
jgi:hypothetical protein